MLIENLRDKVGLINDIVRYFTHYTISFTTCSGTRAISCWIGISTWRHLKKNSAFSCSNLN